MKIKNLLLLIFNLSNIFCIHIDASKLLYSSVIQLLIILIYSKMKFRTEKKENIRIFDLLFYVNSLPLNSITSETPCIDHVESAHADLSL